MMNRIPEYKHIDLRTSDGSDENNLLKKDADDFYIEYLSVCKPKLNTSKLPHRKTLNDFVFICNGEMGKTVCSDNYLLQQGTILFLPPYKIRSFTALSDNIEGFYCSFSDEFIAETSGFKILQDIFHHTNIVNNPSLLLDENHQKRIKQVLTQIKEIYNEDGNLNLIKLYLFTLLGEVRHFVDKLPKRNLNINETLTIRFRKLITDHIQSIHSIQEYADLLNVTPNHLNKSVKATIGKTASDIINEALLMEAKALLSLPENAISDISFALGIDDPSYFSRFFKKHSGISPTDYRKMIDLSL